MENGRKPEATGAGEDGRRRMNRRKGGKEKTDS
jgi:hypothetical protein